VDRPVACSLDAGQAVDRLAEWRAIAALATAQERPQPTTLTVVLDATEAA
jgi:hypothetical protein